MPQTNISLFSPKWGHDDRYSIEMSPSEMNIRMNARGCYCRYVENRDPEWGGDDIFSILSNDMINAPVNLKDLLEHVWLSWRNNGLSENDVEKELSLLANWINTITKSKPNSDFWNEYF